MLCRQDHKPALDFFGRLLAAEVDDQKPKTPVSIQESKKARWRLLAVHFVGSGLHPPAKKVPYPAEKTTRVSQPANGTCELLVCLFVPIQHFVSFLSLISAE